MKSPRKQGITIRTNVLGVIEELQSELRRPPLKAVGLLHLRMIDAGFRRGGQESPWPPLAPGTVAGRRGGSSKPLQDTGRLKQSFDYRISGNSVIVGSNLQIAEYHEEGTSPYTIMPKLGRFLRFRGARGGFVFAKRVRHPGLRKRPMLPSERRAEHAAGEVIEAGIRIARARGLAKPIRVIPSPTRMKKPRGGPR